MKRFLRQSGSGIVLALILFSIIGFASYYLMKQANVTRSKVVVDARVSSYNNLILEVKNKLKVGKFCTQAIGVGTDITDAFQRTGKSINFLLKLPIIPNKNLFKTTYPNNKKWFVAGGTSVADVLLYVNQRIKAPVYFDNDPNPSNPTAYVAAKGYILIRPNHKGVGFKRTNQTKEVNKDRYRIPIILYYYVNGSSIKLYSCFGEGSAGEACVYAGGAYHQDPAIRCRPLDQCLTGSAGVVNSINQINCPSPYKRYIYGDSNSPLLIKYSCLWCNGHSSRCLNKLGSAKFYDDPYDQNLPSDSGNKFQTCGPN